MVFWWSSIPNERDNIPFKAASVIPIWPATTGPSVANNTG